jgi:dolichyl-phosphate-mannose--protein O-mannosyl transferase
LSASTRKSLAISAVAFLLFTLAAELWLSIQHETQTWDEACHIFAGYSYWTRGDFAVNPEHPPFVKLLAALPLLSMTLKAPPRERIFSKEEDFIGAKQFVYSNDAEKILFRTRITAALLTLALAVLVFLAAREMFGFLPAILALTVFAFEPNILAHGALVTTDMGLSCFLFATVYAFYRYLTKPSVARLSLVGLAAGLALAAKHSGILIFPILIALAIYELSRMPPSTASSRARRPVNMARLAGALVAVVLIAVFILWASYGFQFHPRLGVDAEARVVDYSAR